MATQLLYSHLDGALYVPTSSVPILQAKTDKDIVDVSLTCERGLNGDIETFFSASLYAFNGIVELTDVGSLVEEYFRRCDKVADTVTVSFDGVSMDIHFLYCECTVPDDFDADSTFLLSSLVQPVHQDSIVTVAAVNHGAEYPFTIKATGHAVADDVVTVVTKTLSKAFDRNGIVNFSAAEIINWALHKTAEDPGAELRDVLFFSIEYYGIQKLCCIVPAPAYLTFSFRNVYNVTEYVDVVGVMTTKTDVSHSLAVCSGRSRHYDRHIDRTYQIQTGPLTPDEVRTFEQFVSSHQVNLCLDDNDWPVIITDHTCEPSTDDESLASVKFTWRFADNRPYLFNSLMDGVMPTRRRIFDDTFSPEYE